MSKSSSLNDGCVAFNLRRASRIITRRYEESLKPLALTSFQFTTLVALSDYPAIPLSVMAEEFGMSNSTMTRNLKPMLAKNYVILKAHTADARRKLVSITPQGRRMMKKAEPLWQKAQDEALKDLSAPQWAELRQAIQNLT